MVGRDEIQCLIRSLEALPTLPGVAVSIMRIALQHDRPGEHLLRSMELDQSLAVRILRAANGSSYGREGTITSLDAAAQIMGTRPLRSIVLSCSVMDVFEDRTAPYGLDPTGLWLHSVSTAVYAQTLSRPLASVDPKEAFLAGLLHDIGKILLCIGLEEDYPGVVSAAHKQGIDLHQAEFDSLGYDHAQVGAWLLEHWNIPRLYQEVVLNHHRPLEEAFDQERHYLLSCIVAAAHSFSYRHSIGSGGDPRKAPLPPDFLERLPLPREHIEQTTKEAPLLVKKLTKQIDLKPVPLATYYSYLKHANRELGQINQDRESSHYALLQKEKELRGINTVGLALLGCTTTESAVKAIAGGLVTSFAFSRTLCTVYHHDHWEYRAEALRDGQEWVCHTSLKKRSRMEEAIPEPEGDQPWLHVDLIGKRGPLGYLKVRPGPHSDVPMGKIGLLLASYAKLASEALERIQAYQRIQDLSEDLVRALGRLEREKESVETEKREKETILAGLPIGLVLLSKEGLVEFSNPEAQRLLDLDGASGAPKEIQRLFPDPELASTVQSCVRAGQASTPREYSIPGADPLSMRTFRWFLVPLTKEARSATELLFVLQDVTQEKELQRRTVESERMASIGELAAATAHNLRSPLGAAKGILELLLEQVSSGALRVQWAGRGGEADAAGMLKDQLETVVRGVTKCFSVIDDLIDYSRIKGRAAETLRLHELLEGTEALIGDLLRDRGIRIEKDLESDQVFGRKADLIQVFLSLYSNAYKAMPQGGVLTVKSRPYATRRGERPYTEILVSDTGHGIPPESLPRIFDPSFTTSQGAEGTGVGLSLARRILEDHQGRIDVESAVGGGTTFILRIPSAPEGYCAHHG